MHTPHRPATPPTGKHHHDLTEDGVFAEALSSMVVTKAALPSLLQAVESRIRLMIPQILFPHTQHTTHEVACTYSPCLGHDQLMALTSQGLQICAWVTEKIASNSDAWNPTPSYIESFRRKFRSQRFLHSRVYARCTLAIVSSDEAPKRPESPPEEPASPGSFSTLTWQDVEISGFGNSPEPAPQHLRARSAPPSITLFGRFAAVEVAEPQPEDTILFVVTLQSQAKKLVDYMFLSLAVMASLLQTPPPSEHSMKEGQSEPHSREINWSPNLPPVAIGLMCELFGFSGHHLITPPISTLRNSVENLRAEFGELASLLEQRQGWDQVGSSWRPPTVASKTLAATFSFHSIRSQDTGGQSNLRKGLIGMLKDAHSSPEKALHPKTLDEVIPQSYLSSPNATPLNRFSADLFKEPLQVAEMIESVTAPDFITPLFDTDSSVSGSQSAGVMMPCQ